MTNERSAHRRWVCDAETPDVICIGTVIGGLCLSHWQQVNQAKKSAEVRRPS